METPIFKLSDLPRKFDLGKVVMTQGANAEVNKTHAANCLFERHVRGDWGDVCPEDKKLNDQALLDNEKILSVYTDGRVVFWIITEADRSVTTILLPEEY